MTGRPFLRIDTFAKRQYDIKLRFVKYIDKNQ